MFVRYILSSVHLRLKQLPQLSVYGLCVFSLPSSSVKFIKICVLYRIIIKLEVWLINHCLGEVMKQWYALYVLLYPYWYHFPQTIYSNAFHWVKIVVSWSKFSHDDVIKRKYFPRNWPFVRGIHRSPGNSPHKGQWREAMMFSLICVWINGWVNNREAGDLRRCRAHYDVIVMVEVISAGSTIDTYPAPNYYFYQWISMTLYGVTRPQWVDYTIHPPPVYCNICLVIWYFHNTILCKIR